MGPQKLSPNCCGRSPRLWRPERGGERRPQPLGGRAGAGHLERRGALSRDVNPDAVPQEQSEGHRMVRRTKRRRAIFHTTAIRLCVAGSIINKMSKDRRLTLVLLLDLLLMVALVIE